MTDRLRRTMAILDPLTGLPRDIVDTPIPEEVVDEHFVYNAAMGISGNIKMDDTNYVIDIDGDDITEEDTE